MCRQPKKHRRRNVGHLLGASESPDALSIAEDRIRIRPKGATGTRRSARPLTRGWECKPRRRPRAANNGGDDACLKSSGCLTVESAMAHRRQKFPSLKHCVAMRSGVRRTNSSALVGRARRCEASTRWRPGWGASASTEPVEAPHPSGLRPATLPTARLRRLREGKKDNAPTQKRPA
jgi:hypothetical protein